MKHLLIATCLLLAALFSTQAFAKPNQREGKDIFLKQCTACHAKNKSARELHPNSKTQMQWRRFFKRDMHKAQPDVWKKLTDKELDSLWIYLYNGALDGDRPETCG